MRDSTYRLLAEESDLDGYDSVFGDEDESNDLWAENIARFPGAVLPKGGTPFIQRPPTPFRPSPAIAGGSVSSPGPGGGGQVRFERPVATAQAIEQLKADTSKAIAEVRAEARTNLGRLDQRLNSTVSQVQTLGRSVKSSADRVGALEQRSQLFALLPFIQGKPRPSSIKFAGENSAKTVESVTYADKNDMLLPLILMGGLGGSGGSGGSGGGMFGGDNMALLAIAFMNKDD